MIDKTKLVKWLKEEQYGCAQRGENERSEAARELLLKIDRGYFDEAKEKDR